mgnify:FL=1|tara:strand:+ start:2056 stop:3099 length:1044 start_codon:yes stop_codon:yes gene_type:complete
MAEDKNNNELVFDGMPGADAKTEEDVKPFEVDMNFENEPKEEAVEETQAEEVAEEEPVAEETTEEVAEEQVEEPVAQEAESEEQTTEPESVPGNDEQPVEAVEEEPEVETKAPMVPKSRLDEVLAKNKEMQKIIDTMEEKPAENAAPAYDFVTKEREYQNLVLDGETEKAAVLREEIRNAEKEQLMSEVQNKMGQTVQQDREARELQQKAQEIVEVFPIFDPQSKSFDEKLSNEVMELRDAFIYQGYGAADSLAKATEVTLLSKKPELLEAGEEVSQDPAPKLNQVVQDKKSKANVQKKVTASQSQPPQMKGESTQNKKIVDINVLSDDEFGALPEETLRRMRGDFD